MRFLFLRVTCAFVLVAAAFACTKDEAPAAGDPASFGGDGGTSSGESSTSSSGSTSSGSSGTTSSGSSGTSSGNPPKQSFVTLTTETMDFNGLTRSYLLGKPKTYDPQKKYPLVVNFHGNPSTAQTQATYWPFDQASQNDAVIVYPNAADNGGWQLYEDDNDQVDMPWIKVLPAEIAKKVNIDLDKVFGYAYSGGAVFLPEFVCRNGGIFKAIAISEGGGPDALNMGYQKSSQGCPVCPGGPVAALIMTGDQDTTLTPEDGKYASICLSELNGCNSEEPATATTPAPCKKADNCPANAPVKWCLLPNVNHQGWSEAVPQAWSFFKSIP